MELFHKRSMQLLWTLASMARHAQRFLLILWKLQSQANAVSQGELKCVGFSSVTILITPYINNVSEKLKIIK